MAKRKLTEQEKEAARLFGSMGGKAIAKKRGKKGMRKLGKNGADKRWGKTGEAESE